MSKAGKKIFETTEVIIDEEGVVKELKSTFTRKVSRDKFIQVYVEDICSILKIKHGVAWRVLAELWERAEYNTNKLYLVKAVKQDIAEKLGSSYSTITNNIAYLRDKKMIIREDRSVYYLNPVYFFKGSDVERGNVIRKVVEFQYDIK